jgi:hypothetical protein
VKQYRTDDKAPASVKSVFEQLLERQDCFAAHLQREARLRDDLPHPGSVTVHNDTLRPHLVRNPNDLEQFSISIRRVYIGATATHLALGDDGPAQGVLQRYDASGSTVNIVSGDEVRFDVLQSQVVTVRRLDRESVGL